MSFRSLLSIETMAAVLGAALVTFLVDVAQLSPYWLLLAVPLCGLVMGYLAARKRLTALQSGVVAYIDRFAVQNGRSHWTEAREELAYWGVTGASIIEEIKSFVYQEAGRALHYRFLLMSTTGDAIREQVAFKKGFPRKGRTPEQEASISAEVVVEGQRLQAAVAVLKATAASKESPSRLEIRLSDEFLPWWMYLMDHRRAIVGILRTGQEIGDQPAAILTKHPSRITLFESFQETFERVWRSGRPV